MGYRRGALRLGAGLLALLISGFLARPTAGLGMALVGSHVPRALAPLVGAGVSGLIWFVLLSLPFEMLLSRRRKRREEAGLRPVSADEAALGVLMGAVWGFVMLTIIFSGLSAIGHAQRAMRRAQEGMAAAAARPVRRSERGRPLQVGAPLGQQQSILPAERQQSLDIPPAAPIPAASAAAPADASPLEALADQVDNSAMAPMVRRVNPINARMETRLTDLSLVANDPIALKELGSNPAIQKLLVHPKVQAVTADPEFQKALASNDVQKILDVPAIADLAQDPDILEGLKDVPIDRILEDVRRRRERGDARR